MPTTSGAAVLTVLDIGARDGMHRRWQGLPVELIGIEADPDECARLNASGSTRYVPYAVGGHDSGTASFTVTASPGCSSLMTPDEAVIRPFSAARSFTVTRTIPVITTSLDTICEKENLRPDVLKLDIQGSELDVLKGAPRTLSRVLAVETEVEFQPIYVGQPLFRDVDAFMAGLGFTLMGLRRDYWRRQSACASALGGTLVHGDALYVHEERIARQPEQAEVLWKAYKQHDRLRTIPRPALWQ